jgi:hypothetical protein
MKKIALCGVLLLALVAHRLVLAEIKDCEPSTSWVLQDGVYTNILGSTGGKPVKSITVQLTTTGDAWVWPVFATTKTNRFFITGKGSSITFKGEEITSTTWKAAGSGGTPTIEVNRCYQN